MKKLLAIILCAILALSLFAACGDGSSQSSATPTPSQSGQATPAPSTGGDESEGNDSLAVLDGGIFKLPIVDEKITFELFDPWNVAGSNMLDNNDSHAYKEAEKRTNIHINWQHPAANMGPESFNLSIASNDYCDAYLIGTSYLTNGPDYFIDNDIFIDLEPYIKEFAPNYDYVRNYHDVVNFTLTDNGYSVGFWQIAQTIQWSFTGPMGRADWRAELGLDIPETYDELHDYMVAVTDRFNPEFPLGLAVNGFEPWLMAGFDTMYNTQAGGIQFIQINDKVHFGAFEPGFREYVQLVADWYAEGLVDKEFFTRTGLRPRMMDTGEITTNKSAVGNSLYTYIDHVTTFVEREPDLDQNIAIEGFKMPVKNKGDTRKLNIGTGVLNNMKNSYNCLSTQVDNLEILIKWFDYFYTEEGSLLCNYGIEGQSYNLVDGKPVITDLIYANPDGLAINSALPFYATNQMLAAWYDWEREISPKTSQAVWDTKELFDGNWVDEYSIPESYLTMTSEENTEFAAIMSDINTFLEENMVRIIIGNGSMSEFDGIMNQVKTMKIDRAIELKQAAYDRFLNRGN